MNSGPIKILHLLSYHLFTGPAEPVLNLARAQLAAGHQVRMAVDTLRSDEVAGRFVQAGLALDARFSLSVKSGPILNLRDILAFKRLWNSNDVDIIHAHRSHDHTLAALARPRKTGVRLIRTLHTERAAGPKRDWQLNRADGLICISEATRRDLLQRGFLDEARVMHVEGAVDANRFSPTAERKLRGELGIPAESPVAGIVARMKADRHHLELIQAWIEVIQRLPQACLLIVGRGEMEDELRAFCARYGLAGSVKFIGYRTDLEQVYPAFDLKVILAPGNDGTCRAALEAMACGVPVLAARRGALAEIVGEGRTGRLVPAGEPSALSQVLVELLSDRERLRVMGSNARDEALSRFTIERQLHAVDALYLRVLEGRE